MQIVELERLDQVAVPDQAAVGDADVGHPRDRPGRSWRRPRRACGRCGTPRSRPASTRCMSSRISAVGLPPSAWRNLSSRPSARSAASFGSCSWIAPGLTTSASRRPGGAAEHDEVDQAVGAEAVGAVDADAGRFADREQAGHDRVRIAVLQGDDFAMIVGRDAAHRIVDRRRDRDRLAGQVDAREGLRGLGDARQPLVQDLRVDMVEVKEDMVLVLADAAAFADFHRHRA